MTDNVQDTDQLVESAATGDQTARRELLRRHRDRLKRMVAFRMDPRVRSRFDPSDVIQDALVTANQRLTRYLVERPLPFYPWLRNIAWERLSQLHKQHLGAQKRSALREVGQANKSAAALVDLLAGKVTGPSQKLMRNEMRRRVNEALVSLKQQDRELLELMYLEQMNPAEVAAILNVTPTIVRKRHFRAIRRLSQVLENDG